MSFAENNWCKQIILLITIIYCYGAKALISLAEKLKPIDSRVDYIDLQINNLENQISPKELSCSKINPTYQKVYSFETENSYINLCQLENSFYYYRQSKLDAENNLLIAAQPVFGGQVFQATNGKTIYFIGKNGDRYYSSVMLNNDKIVLEPELIPTPIAFSQDIVDSGVNFYFGEPKLNSIHSTTNVGWMLKAPMVCVQDKSFFNPNLDNWQSLLGKPTNIANKYTLNSGHDFAYDHDSQEPASITTKMETIVELNFTKNSEILEQVCIQSAKNI